MPRRKQEVWVTNILRRLHALSWRRWRLLGEAAVLLPFAAAAIAFLPFATVARFASSRGASPARAIDRVLAREIGWAVQAVGRRMPFRAKCFERGLTAQWMLRRRGFPATMFYGAKLQQQELLAHVWVRAGDLDVVGGEIAGEYATLAQFPAVGSD